MFNNARQRARAKGVPFNITKADVQIPTHCPILGIPLAKSRTGKPADHSPSLDRLRPELGYVPGNVAVISQRANRLKNDGTAEELRRIADWIESR